MSKECRSLLKGVRYSVLETEGKSGLTFVVVLNHNEKTSSWDQAWHYQTLGYARKVWLMKEVELFAKSCNEE